MKTKSEFNLSFEVEGHFSLKAVKVDGSGERKLAEFSNLILDNGLAYLLGASQPSDCLAFFRVGSGSTPPVNSQAALVSQIASTATLQEDTSNYTTSSPYMFFRRVTRRFGQGVAAGNIAEVGVGWAASGNTLFSRALVLDASGNPTVVTVLADEFLDVTYTFRVYPPLTDVLSTLNLNGTAHEVIMRAAGLGTLEQLPTSRMLLGHPLAGVQARVSPDPMGDMNSSPAQGTEAHPAWALYNYVAGSYNGDVDLTWGLTQANLAGGIRTIRVRPAYWHALQMQFTPPLPKTASQVLRLRVRVSLARRSS